jgi:hypothetical protein
MADANHHAESSVRKWGGCVSDYMPLHKWFDATKAHLPDMRHRAIRHHAQGIDWLIEVFGERVYLHLPDGNRLVKADGSYRWIPTRWVGEQHVMEDLGRIPTVADWLRELPMRPQWMAANAISGKRLMEGTPV